MNEPVDLSIIIPCLNEAETLAACIAKAHSGIERAGVRGEIVVADNGSTDGSAAIAQKCGARLVTVLEKGYGSALRGGVNAAAGRWIIMGDADESYDFSRIEGFVERFREGYDVVIGCRLPAGGGTISPGAMPWKNRWIGNPVLSFIGRIFFKSPVRDFHCGLRGFTKAAFEIMDLKTTGMEFASEMVVKATLKSLRIGEVPITLYPDGRSRPPHLKPWRDGWRHLRFLLIYSPLWLFLLPGMIMLASGTFFAARLTAGNIRIGLIQLDVGALTMACMAMAVGFQLVAFAFFTKVFAISEGLLPEDRKFARVFKFFTLEKGILAGLLLLLLGVIALLRAVWIWKQADFGVLSYAENLRRIIPSTSLIMLGVQSIFSSFFMSVLGLKTVSRKPPGSAADGGREGKPGLTA